MWLIISVLFLVYGTFGSFTDDLQKVLDSYEYDPKCVFNHSEITSKTIKFFPKCGMIFGILVINSNTDLSEVQLKDAFKTMTSLVGGLRVENSNLQSLSFFTLQFGQDDNFPIYCKTHGIFIRNNSKLNDARMLLNTRLEYDEYQTEDCEYVVENNEKLNMGALCEKKEILKITTIQTRGNFKNCGCTNEDLSAGNCNVLKNLVIRNSINSSIFSNIKTIRGPIDIQNSNIKDLSFLKSFDLWNLNSNENLVFNLKNNPNMTRLNFPNMKTFQNLYDEGFVANFENLHPDFCVTIAELKFILEDLKFSFLHIHAKICEDFGDLKRKVVCRSESMYDLPNNCDIILGNLNIEAGDEEDCSKLRYIDTVIGTVTIRNTQLKNLDDFDTIEYIAVLDDSTPVLQIVGNSNLKNPVLAGLYKIITRDNKRVAILQDNHPDAFKTKNSKQSCEKVGAKMYLNATGGDCGKRVEIKYGTRSGTNFLNLLMTFVFFFHLIKFLLF